MWQTDKSREKKKPTKELRRMRVKERFRWKEE